MTIMWNKEGKYIVQSPDRDKTIVIQFAKDPKENVTATITSENLALDRVGFGFYSHPPFRMGHAQGYGLHDGANQSREDHS